MKRTSYRFTPQNAEIFKNKLLHWANQFDKNIYLESNSNEQISDSKYETYDSIFAIDEISSFKNDSIDKFDEFDKYVQSTKDWIFGHIDYDTKNQIENLSSKNDDSVLFPEFSFFQPKYLFLQQGKDFILMALPLELERLLNEIESYKFNLWPKQKNVLLTAKIKRAEYIETIGKIQEQIGLGNIYELNFCFEYQAKNAIINPIETWQNLRTRSFAPMSCYYKNNNHYLLCSSPERFVKKIGTKLIAQPIKGTAKRSMDSSAEVEIKLALKNSAKEQNENVMIVDLVRNDLSRVAKKQSVIVEELFEVYTFKQVHQLISTITCDVDSTKTIGEIIKSNFPMGSMTGAPKISAMNLIEQYEQSKRGIYSGSVGYIDPNGDFDFNVVIRSIIYNSENKYLSYSVGSAITSLSNANEEYEECLLKAKVIEEVFKKN